MVEENKQQTEIPNLEMDAKNRIIEQTKKIPLKINGEEVEITIRKLKTGIRNKIRSECTTVRVLGGQQQINVNSQEIQEKILAETIVDAPFETTVADIKNLPSEVTDYLSDEYNKFAEPDSKKKVELKKV